LAREYVAAAIAYAECQSGKAGAVAAYGAVREEFLKHQDKEK
jgi:hypothetical protein